MHITSILAGMGVACAIFGIDRAMRNRKEKQHGSRKKIRTAATTRIPQSADKRQLHWINTEKLMQLISSDPDLLVFHLLDDNSTEDRSSRLPGELAVTLPQLEEALPWIPHGSKVAIYRLDGIDAVLARRITMILQNREALMLSGTLPHTKEKEEPMAGKICN